MGWPIMGQAQLALNMSLWAGPSRARHGLQAGPSTGLARSMRTVPYGPR